MSEARTERPFRGDCEVPLAVTSRELATTPGRLARAYFTVRNSEYVIVPSTSSMADAAAA